jgi:hypothetical protein
METTANAPAGTGQAMTVRLNVHDARCGALFVSGLEPSDAPTAGSVTESISRAVRRFGTCGCAGRGAQESGDHPRSSPGGCAGPANSLLGRPPAGLPAGPEPPGRPLN